MPEVDFLLDSDVVIDWLRDGPGAKDWLARQGQSVPGIPYLVTFEILQGARNQAELVRLREGLTTFVVLPPEPADAAVAEDLFVKHHLSDGPGLLDCLIGALALRLDKPIYTFNLRHLGVFAGVDARIPYER